MSDRRNALKPVLAASLALLFVSGMAQSAELTRHPQGAKASVCYTFDDWAPDHYSIVAPLLERHGVRGTFFIIAGRPNVDWAQVADLAKRGHEIGNHSLTHKNFILAKLSPEEIRKEVDEPKRIMFEKLGFVPETFAYPGNATNAEITAYVESGHIASRTACAGFDNLSAEAMNAKIDELLAQGGDLVVMLHSLADPAKAAEFEKHLSCACSKKGELFIGTFAFVSKFKIERESCEAVFDGETMSLKALPGKRLFPGTKLSVKLTSADGREAIVEASPGENVRDIDFKPSREKGK